MGRVLTDYARSLGGGKALADSLMGPAWRRAHGRARRPCGVVSPEEGYRLAGLYQRALKDEMRRVCSRFASAQLFFAVRTGQEVPELSFAEAAWRVLFDRAGVLH